MPIMEKQELTRLILACQQGDRQAMERLLEEIQGPVYYQCRKILGSEQDALDAAQEILIVVLNKLETLREPEAFWGWLNCMTANRCKNLLTRSCRDLQFWEDEEGSSILDQFENMDDQEVPDRAVDNTETRRMVAELVDALPPAQRLCVLMFYYDELPVKEIAATLEVPENTVKSRLNYTIRSTSRASP